MIRDPPITDLNLRPQVFDQHRADFNSVLFYHKRFTPSSSFVSVVVFRSGFPGSFSLHLRRSERTDGGGERQQAQEGESLCSTWLQKVRSLSPPPPSRSLQLFSTEHSLLDPPVHAGKTSSPSLLHPR